MLVTVYQDIINAITWKPTAWVDMLEGGIGCACPGGKMMYVDTYSEWKEDTVEPGENVVLTMVNVVQWIGRQIAAVLETSIM